MTSSRKHLFALLGLVLPVAAFTASPVAAATASSMSHTSHKQRVSASSHKAKKSHAHNVSHRARHTAPKVSAS